MTENKPLSEKVDTLTEDTLTKSRARYFFFKSDVKEAVEKLKEKWCECDEETMCQYCFDLKEIFGEFS